uniref:Uncharacterized protein n=1 Tax=Plectus sambesii TaxID=2011161 RepID=A0A914WA64_9BILA
MVRRKANISPSLTFNSKMGRFDDEDEEEEPIDGDDFRDAVEQVFDEERSSQMTQEGRGFADTGERIEPEDLFERTLEEAGVQLRDYGDDVTRTFIVDEDLNHAGFVRKLTDILAESNKKQKDFFEAFERNVRDERKLEIVLMPSDSAGFGQQDTVMRGLLLVPSLQKPVFRLVIDKMDYYALKASQNEKSVRLTQWLLAQFRYLETVYDSRALFDCIFQVELVRWPPAIRNALIDALPEVLVDVDVQQDVAKNLHEMFDKQQQVGPDSDSMRLAILRCLSLLNINVDTLEPIRAALLSSLKTASGSLVPEIVRFCLETIGAKEKGAFKEILEGIRSNLNLSRFKNDNYADTDQDPVTQVMHEITVKVRFDESHFAKDTVAFLRTGIDTEGRKTFKEFDVLLGIAVFEDQLCQERVLTEFRHQITNSVEDSFGKLITSVLELQAFIRSRFKALLRLIEQLVWAADMVVAEFGARMYKSLFLAFDGDYRQEVVIAMTSDHVNSVESETTVVLGCLKQLAKSHPSLMLPYAVFVQSLFDTIGYLTMDNVRTLFEVMVTLYAHVDDEGDSSADDFHIAINKFLVSSSARDNVWGVLGMLMQLKQELNARSKSEDEKERMIEQTLGLLDKCTKPNAKVRAVFYEQMAEIFLSNPQNIPRSAALVNWYDGLCAQFRDEFFKTRPAGKENSLLGLEKKGFVNSESAEWLQLSELISDANKADEKTETRLVTLVPLFRLLRAFARVHREWDNAVDDNLNGLLFTLEANLSLSNCADVDGSVDALSKCHTLYYSIRWLREIVNTFSDAKLGEENQAKVAELLQKRYAHMVACHRELEQIIKKIGRYPLPSEQLDACQTVVVYNVEQPKKKPAVKKEKKAKKAKKEKEEKERAVVVYNVEQPKKKPAVKKEKKAKKAKKEKEEKEKEEDGGGTADSDDDAPPVENDQAEIDAESA